MSRNFSKPVCPVSVSKPLPTVNPSKHICSFNIKEPIRSVNSKTFVRPVNSSNFVQSVDIRATDCNKPLRPVINSGKPVRPFDVCKAISEF